MESDRNQAAPPNQNSPFDIEKIKQIAAAVQEWCADPKRKEDLLDRLGDAKETVKSLMEHAKAFLGEQKPGGENLPAEGADYESNLGRIVSQCTDLLKTAGPKMMDFERMAVEKLKSDGTAEKVKDMTEGIRRRLADIILTGLDPKSDAEDRDGGEKPE